MSSPLLCGSPMCLWSDDKGQRIFTTWLLLIPIENKGGFIWAMKILTTHSDKGILTDCCTCHDNPEMWEVMLISQWSGLRRAPTLASGQQQSTSKWIFHNSCETQPNQRFRPRPVICMRNLNGTGSVTWHSSIQTIGLEPTGASLHSSSTSRT